MKELFPRSAIDIFVEVLQADAGSRTACLNAASVALIDAGVPMRGMVTSVAVAKVDGVLVLDGDGDYVECENNEKLNFGTDSFSISAWMKNLPEGSSYRTIAATKI